MGERTTYATGTFSWTDLATPDPPAAKRFYGELFGWEAEDFPIGDGAVYSMMRIGGKDVAAISPQQEQQRDAGAPPAWNSYVTVQSADQSAARVQELGGSVHAPPFDVMHVGRMAVATDPQGAFFLLWEPKAHIGAGLVNAPGALAWNELATGDLDASAQFYTDLFGWTVTPVEGFPMPYRTIKTAAGNTNGGMRNPMEGEPPNWLVYFGTDDVDASLAKVSDLGGSQMGEPLDIGVGKLGFARDPQGAVFALYGGRFED